MKMAMASTVPGTYLRSDFGVYKFAQNHRSNPRIEAIVAYPDSKFCIIGSWWFASLSNEYVDY